MEHVRPQTSVRTIFLSVSPQCYYIGATSDAATKMINEVSKPMSYHVPVEKICEKLKKKDSQICELKYGEEGSTSGRNAAAAAPPALYLMV